MTTDYTPIPCRDYDVLELVCARHHELELTLDDGSVVVGTALTLEIEAAAEYLLLRLASGASGRIRIDRLRRLVVRTTGARTDAHTFATAP